MPDRFYYPLGEQYGMPPRHISPQSFDDILSELGDDPAIPDPHGIRKTSSPPRVDQTPQTKTPKPAFPAKAFELKGFNFSPIWILISILLLSAGGLFFHFDSNKSGAELEISALQNQLLELKEEFQLSQSEWVSERDDLYEIIDEIEVSIHSIESKPPIKSSQSKPAAIPYEAELRRWRYLGITRMGVAEHAFFHTGKTTLMVRKESLALGEWRLTQAEKELAILAHPKGKSITFKSTQSE
ncbi:hypothetical protein ICN42_02905 [Polynucleobacter sp. 71A-WALBACH]|uniref:hypothetical protein n=1 Tax=Polynucleobacter sp. 71A-WALBACH TaxID=2689097 RepID=UPI001C0D3275|nr:hypothetical protein [Polynucleobacter sp. 71A-WALBACH]MBU3593040.1 hypothetical protein [Polynucleobacter sp. 71A-WALBACH]